MKANVFIEIQGGVYRSIGLQEDFYASQISEDDIIQDIDEESMTPQKIVADRFLKFLGNQRMNIARLLRLPETEQKRIKKQFMETIE